MKALQPAQKPLLLAPLIIISTGLLIAFVDGPAPQLARLFTAIGVLYVLRFFTIASIEKRHGKERAQHLKLPQAWERNLLVLACCYGIVGVVWLMGVYEVVSIIIVSIVFLIISLILFPSLKHVFFTKKLMAVINGSHFTIGEKTFNVREVFSVWPSGPVYVALSEKEDEQVCRGMVVDPKLFGDVFECKIYNAGELEAYLKEKGFVEEFTGEQRKLLTSIGADEYTSRLVNKKRHG